MSNTIELKNEKHTKREFARMRSVLACAATDSTRHVINKVLVEAEDEGIAIVATDGRRLRRDRFAIEAEPGIYDIKVNSGKAVFLTQCTEALTFPNYLQVIPRDSKDDAYALEGNGKQFVLWATAGLGCLIDPKLVELGDDEAVTLYLQRSDPALGAVLARNADTVFVVMPLRLDQPWIREVEAIVTERVVKAMEEKEAEALAA
jgi:hypothetical protein